MTEEFKTYTCTYPFDGSHWGFDLKARNPIEAEERRKALAWSKIDGEVVKFGDFGEATRKPPGAGVNLDLIERGFLWLADSLFRVLNGYVRVRNWMVRP